MITSQLWELDTQILIRNVEKNEFNFMSSNVKFSNVQNVAKNSSDIVNETPCYRLMFCRAHCSPVLPHYLSPIDWTYPELENQTRMVRGETNQSE